MEHLTLLPLPANAFRGLHIAITGTLPVTRAEMIMLIETHGGTYNASVTMETDILIVGVLRPSKALPDGISRKLRRARQLQLQNRAKSIQIIPFESFIAAVSCSTT